MAGEIDSSVLGIFVLMIFLFVFFILIAYIYQALTLYHIARKTKTSNEWLAWIPIGNLVLMAKIAKMHWWPVLLYIPMMFFIFLSGLASILGNTILDILFSILGYIPMIILGVYMIIWMWKIYERVSRPGYWSVFPLIISLISLILTISGVIFFNMTLFWIGVIGIIVGVLQQYVYLGVAAWHKDSVSSSINKKMLSKNNKK